MKYDHTFPFSLVQMQRPKLSKPSYVPMRGVWSVDLPQNLSGHKDPTFSMDPPEPSCVSMKSDWSMEPPRNFREHTVSSNKTDRYNTNLGFSMDPPEPSCVSMKSDWSMEPPRNFRGHTVTSSDKTDHYNTNLGFSLDLPEPSCVSMKSDWSMEPPRNFSGHTEFGFRPDPPVSSCVSRRSDKSVDPSLNFSGYTDLWFRLSNCGVTAEGCAVLASALRSNPSRLRELDLSENKLQDSGLNLLSDGLKDPHCKLEKLMLIHCGVADEGCAALASALKSNSSNLRELDLTWNNLQNTSLTLLAVGLKDPHCKLEKLTISYCDITHEGCAALASALRSNLRELDLTGNNLGEGGLTLLSDGLKDPHCKLEKLRLSDCDITAEGCAALASVLRSNPSHLRELDLTANNLGDRSVKLLSAGLKCPHCKLETLKLWDCAITDTSCAVLASALRSNPSHLRELNLLGNKLGYRGLKLLSVLKDQPLYKLETLLY
uniref:Uncharacterized protein n=2 Tax=Cyprinus carpio TaxID=7962 RepID=A0A8C1LF45_CYPCA